MVLRRALFSVLDKVYKVKYDPKTTLVSAARARNELLMFTALAPLNVENMRQNMGSVVISIDARSYGGAVEYPRLEAEESLKLLNSSFDCKMKWVRN